VGNANRTPKQAADRGETTGAGNGLRRITTAIVYRNNPNSISSWLPQPAEAL
jgi:hypothetical protein